MVLKSCIEQVKNSELSLKLCASLLLVSAQRVQTIHLIRLRCIQFRDEGCTLHIIDKLKRTRPGYHQNAVQLPKYVADEKLCVINCLKNIGKEQLPWDLNVTNFWYVIQNRSDPPQKTLCRVGWNVFWKWQTFKSSNHTVLEGHPLWQCWTMVYPWIFFFLLLLFFCEQLVSLMQQLSEILW